MHEVNWTPELIRDFWNKLSRIPAVQAEYFSANHGLAIADAIRRWVPADATVLDFGCGRGDFLEALLSRGYRGIGVDSSEDSVAQVQKRLQGRPGFLGAFVSGAADVPKADFLTAIEVVEHVAPDQLVGFLSYLRGSLKSGGLLIATCPHQEDLERAKVLCPECGSHFHPMQHMARMTVQSLSSAAVQAGFAVVVAQPTLLAHNRQTAGRGLLGRLYFERLRPDRAPHLLFVAKATA